MEILLGVGSLATVQKVMALDLLVSFSSSRDDWLSMPVGVGRGRILEGNAAFRDLNGGDCVISAGRSLEDASATSLLL